MTKLNFNPTSNSPCNNCGGCNARHPQECRRQWQQFPPQYPQYPQYLQYPQYPQYQQYHLQGGRSVVPPVGLFQPPRPAPVMNAGEGIPMDFHYFTESRDEHHLALDIKDYIKYLETAFPGSYELDDFVRRSKEVLRNEVTHFDFGPSRWDIHSFKDFLAVCKRADDRQRAPNEQYREAIPKYEDYLGANSPVDFVGFKAARVKQAKDDRLTLNNEEDFNCCCYECEEDFNFDADSFFDNCINDADVDVVFTAPVNEIHDPNLYDEDSDDGDDTILNLSDSGRQTNPESPVQSTPSRSGTLPSQPTPTNSSSQT